LIAATLDQLLDQRSLVISQHDISGGHIQIHSETGMADYAKQSKLIMLNVTARLFLEPSNRCVQALEH
jgi:hypothetical protein